MYKIYAGQCDINNTQHYFKKYMEQLCMLKDEQTWLNFISFW